MTESAGFPICIVDHPLAAVALTEIRDAATGSPAFRDALARLSTMLICEAAAEMPTVTRPVQTPVAETNGTALASKPIVVPVLRAGLGMLAPTLAMMPEAQVGFVGIARNEETAQPEPYLESLPDDLTGRQVFVLDPMLATGGSLLHAIDVLARRGADRITAVCVVAAPEGIAALGASGHRIRLVVGAVDERLNEVSYIVPGLGDAGDRQFGPR